MNNLAAIDIHRHLRYRGVGASQTIALYVPGAEVKNGVPIEHDLPREAANLVRLYLKSYRELISSGSQNWLFPRATVAGHRSPASQYLTAVIHRETGLRMNGHLFRHLAGKLFLERHPDGHETVRQFLGHK